MSDTPAPKPELEAGGREVVAREINASKGGADSANKKDAADRKGSLISKTLASAKDPTEEEDGDAKKAVVVTEVAGDKDRALTQEDAAPKPVRPSVPPRPSPDRKSVV